MSNKRSNVLFAFVVLAMIVSLFIGCAKKPFWGNEQTGFILNYRLVPDQVWKYSSTNDQNMNMEQMGQSIAIKTKSLTIYSIKGTGINQQKNLQSNVTLDTMSIAMSSPMGENKPDLSSVIGKNFGMTFTSKGKELDYTRTEALEIDFGKMPGGKQDLSSYFRNIFPDLPEQPVKIGETWISKDSLTIHQMGMEVKTKTETTNKLEGQEVVAGMECLKIASKSKGTVDGKGENMGMNMSVEGDTDATTTWYFAYKLGIFVKAESESFMESKIAISGPQNMTMPMSQETKSEVKLILSPAK
ncbi:MAG: hypothetical protein MUC94_11540 [bacterium]|nr:hypothetical protein [bacterium]